MQKQKNKISRAYPLFCLALALSVLLLSLHAKDIAAHLRHHADIAAHTVVGSTDGDKAEKTSHDHTHIEKTSGKLAMQMATDRRHNIGVSAGAKKYNPGNIGAAWMMFRLAFALNLSR